MHEGASPLPATGPLVPCGTEPVSRLGHSASVRLRDAMLRHAGNLERYPFESATMAEAGRLAANAIRSAVREVHGDEGEALYDALSASAGYLRNAAIDLETGAPKATALRTINGGLKRVEAALAIAMAPDRAANEDLPVPKDCQARAESIAQPQPSEHERRGS